MIVPAMRLIVLAGLLLPATGLLAATTGGGAAGLVLAALLGAVLADAFFSRSRPFGLAVEAPLRMTLTRGRQGEIAFRVRHPAGGRPFRLGLVLPPELHSPERIKQLRPGRDAQTTGLSWPVTADTRGSFTIDTMRVRIRSLLGLWEVQGTLHCSMEVLVYPDVRGERKQLAALFLNRGQFGLHLHRQVGKGREFEKLRDYIPGDSPEDIHWKASAKRGELVTKEYRIERSQDVYVAVDASRLSGRRTAAGDQVKEAMLERMVTAALVLGQAAERQGDRFGVIVFSDRVERFIRAGSGRHHSDACRDALYDIRTSRVSPDFEEAAGFIGSRLRHRALLLFLTSLDEPALAEDFVSATSFLARKHVVQVVMPRPPLARPLFDGEEVKDPAEVYTRLGGHLVWTGLHRLGRMLGRHNLGMGLAEADALSAGLVSRYLEVKRRQVI